MSSYSPGYRPSPEEAANDPTGGGALPGRPKTGGFTPQPAPNRPRPQVLGQPQTGGFTPGQATPQTQQFGPGQNLIGTQINPVGSQRGQNAAGATDRAAGAVQGFQTSPFQTQSANTSQSQGIYDNLLKSAQGGGVFGGGGGGGAPSFDVNGKLQPLLDKVTNAPDRGQLAQDMYGQLEERARPGYEQRLRSVNQRAGAMGRGRAGLTTSELGDVEMIHNRDLDLSRRELASQGAGHTLDDRMKQLGAAKDVYGAVSAAGSNYNNSMQAGNQQNFNNMLTLGRDFYGRESDAYGRGVGERDAQLGYDQTQFGNRRSQLQDSSIYEQDIYGRDRDSRDEYRGERDYQYGAERDAQGDRERQYGMQEDSKDRDWNRAYQGAQFGYGTNPAGAVGAAADRRSSNAQFDPTQMFSEWARRNRNTPAPGRPPAAETPYGQVPDGYSPF